MSKQVFTLMTHSYVGQVDEPGEGYLEGIFATAEGAVQYARQIADSSNSTVLVLSDETDDEGAREIRLQHTWPTGTPGHCMTVAAQYVQRMRGEP